MTAAAEIPESVEIQKHLTSIHIDAWIKDDVFTIRWWILLLLIIASFIVWWILLDKSRLKEACLLAAGVFIITLGIDEYGQELVLWDYPIDIIPIFPPLTSINLLILPLTYSLIYQHFQTRKSFIWATLIITAIICLIFEPLLSWGGLYKLLNWQTYYSFPIYAVMAVFVRQLTIRIRKINEKADVQSRSVKESSRGIHYDAR